MSTGGACKLVSKKHVLTFMFAYVVLSVVLYTSHKSGFALIVSHLPKAVSLVFPDGERCVREVLRRLQLPTTRSSYWMETFEEPLPFSNLSATCRSFLTPAPVSPLRKRQLACFLSKPWIRSLGPGYWDRVRGAVHIIRDAFYRARVPLLLDSGTALGSWRLHGQITFDPDIDFVVFRRDKERAIKVMADIQRAHPNLIHNYKNGNSDFWRLDVLRADKSRLFQIDVFVHTLREKDRVVDTIQHPHHLRVDRLLPLVQRPFAGALFHTFRNMPDYIAQVYGHGAETQCATHYWIPSFFNMSCATRRVQCAELNYFFPFVHRWLHPTGQLVEVLFNRTHALSVFYGPHGV